MEQASNPIIKKTLKNPLVDYSVMFAARFFYSLLTSIEIYYFVAFLTDTAVFSLVFTAIILILTSLVDTFLTGFYYSIMERIGRHLPWGVTRSWLIIAPPVAAAALALTFSGIGAGKLISALIVIVGFIISHIAWSVGEQAMNAQVHIMTDELNQRAQLSSNITRGIWAASIAFGYAGAAFIFLMPENRLAFVWMTVFFGLLYWIGFILLFWRSSGCEPAAHEDRPRRGIGLRAAYRGVLKDRNGLMVLIIIFTAYCAEFLMNGLMYYYFRYTLDAPVLMPLNMTLRGAFAAAGAVFFVPLLLRACQGSKRRAQIITQIMAVVFPLVCFHPAIRTNAWVYIWVSVFQAFFSGTGTYMNLSALKDVCTFMTYKTGKDYMSVSDSLVMFPVKIAMVLRSLLTVAVIGLTGYSAGMVITEHQVNGFAAGYLVIAALLNLIPLICWIIYRLPEAQVQAMREENRKAEKHVDNVGAIR